MDDQQQQFLNEMEEILNAEEPISLDSKLEDMDEWDSIATVAFFALARTNYGKKINRQAIINAETIRDLFEMIK